MSQVQGLREVVPGGIAGDDAVEGLRPALGDDQRLAAAGRASGEVDLGGLGPVGPVEEEQARVACLLEGVAGGEVAQRLVVDAEGAVQGGRGGGVLPVPGVAGEGRVAAGQRRGPVRGAERHVPRHVGDGAVVTAAPEHQRLAVPVAGQGEAHPDVGRGGVHGVEVGLHPAVLDRRAADGARHDRGRGDPATGRRETHGRGRDPRPVQGGAPRRRRGAARGPGCRGPGAEDLGGTRQQDHARQHGDPTGPRASCRCTAHADLFSASHGHGSRAK